MPCPISIPDPFYYRPVHSGETYHRRLRREELQREVVGAIRQRIDLIRNLLHLAISLGNDRNGVVAGGAVS
jgi:hypothetical protein